MLFDIDGTLVDSNYLHVHAWQRAFQAEGLQVPSWRIHRCIGMDGFTLVQELSGDTDDAAGQRLKDGHSRFYRDTARLLAPLPGARNLLRRVASEGLQVVLATSAPEDELALLREVLDCDDVVSAVTSSQDVETAKPRPDIVAVALERASVTAAEAVFVGDAVWDCQAAGRAGVTSIGLLTGGVSRAELMQAGASAVFDDAAALSNSLAGSAIGALMVRTR
ncbi:HAD family hydrolase [Mycolicibacterium sp.]|uniref:HAD family hydrolase n=1 Tax=Mycolicibacterium sp. TaxID=2320850 RepID=UPI003D14CBF8